MIRRLLALLLPLLVLAGCQDRELPTALAPERPLFDHVGASYVVSNTNDSGEGSLRYAIEHIEAGGTITFAAALSGQTIRLTSGELTINKNLTIIGPGADLLTVARSSAAGTPEFRIFEIGSHGATQQPTVTLSGLTISGGNSPTSGAWWDARYGGGIYNLGTLTLTHSTVSGNEADGSGGGIYNWGTLTLTNSTVSGNNASEHAASGGGIYNEGTLMLTNSTVSGNDAWQGGGIFNHFGTLTLTNSTVSGNSATVDGGGIWSLGTLTITNSTVSDNHAGLGGGIYNYGENYAEENDFIHGTLTITHSTIVGNSADFGGGILSWFGTATLRNTIVANSPSGGNCTGTITDGGYNLEGGDGTTATTSCGFSGTSQSVADAKLGPLALNAPGTTETHALQVGSPAVDAGTCTDHEDNTVTTDQRGVSRPRPSGGNCDIGAFERTSPAIRMSINANGRVNRRTGVATLSGIVTCSEPLPITLSVSLNQQQKQGKTAVIVTGSQNEALSCSGTTAWTAQVTPTNGKFSGGAAGAMASVVDADPPVQSTQAVLLK